MQESEQSKGFITELNKQKIKSRKSKAGEMEFSISFLANMFS